jgi:hypothetical protein
MDAELGGIDVGKGAERGWSDVKLETGQVCGVVRGRKSNDVVAGNTHLGLLGAVATLQYETPAHMHKFRLIYSGAGASGPAARHPPGVAEKVQQVLDFPGKTAIPGLYKFT